MKRILAYLQPFFKVLAFFGCYFFMMSMAAALLIPMLAHIDLTTMTPEEFAGLESNASMLLLMQLSSLVGLLLALFIFSKFPPRKDYVSLGLTGDSVLKDTGLGILAGTAIILVSFLILWLSGTVESLELNEAFSPGKLLIWLVIYLIVAFVEEVMFRGYFLNVFMERFSPLVAILTTSLLFGMMHVLNPSFGWLGFVNITLAGMLMGLAFFRRGSIWLPVGLHMGWNFVQGTVLGFHVSGIEAETVFQLQLQGSKWLSGGDFGLEGSVITSLVCLGAIVLIYYYGRLSLQPLEFDEHESD